eukprot:5160860-Prymnesium_polylepis.1
MSAAHAADRLICLAVLVLRTPVRLSADRLVSTLVAGRLSRRVGIVPPPRYKFDLERPLSTGSRSRRSNPTAARLPRVPTPARVLGGAVVGRRATMVMGRC